MHARIWINDRATDGNFSKSFLVKLARMGAQIYAYPDGSNEPVDMDTPDGFQFIKDYNGSKQ